MALGGGTFTVQNKELPGTYINFVSAAAATAALSNRGIATMPLLLDWGVDGEVFTVESSDFQKNALKIFGYEYTHAKLKGLRDLFLNAKTLHAYKLTSGGEKAKNDFATAKYSGIRGNALKIVIRKNIDDETLYDVSTLLDTAIVDEQTVKNASELVSNDFVTFNDKAELAETAAVPLNGGTNGEVNGTAHQNYLDKIEAYGYNTMGVTVTDDSTKGLYAAFCRRLRDEMGIKFQLVLHQYTKADYYGIISVENDVSDTDDTFNAASAVYWVTGAEAGCEVNRSVQNRKYDGEFNISAQYSQTDLKNKIKSGAFIFHKEGADIRVLDDINTMVTTSETQGDIFKDNQTVRVMDQIANDMAVLFKTKYLGVVPNDNAGRISLWSDIVKLHEQLQELRAIENFSDSDITIDQGDTKKSVVVNGSISVVNAMSKLYMTVTVA